MAQKEVLFGLYDDEEELLAAVKTAKEQHLDIMDVFSPFPVHGLDPLLGLKESRLHVVGFIFGFLGLITAFGFMTWAMASDWQMIIGGKPYWPVPSFIPITFEVTVLFSSIGMVVAFYTVCGMGPGVVNPTLHDRITDDKFCVAFNISDAVEEQKEKYNDFLSSTGASLIDKKVI